MFSKTTFGQLLFAFACFDFCFVIDYGLSFCILLQEPYATTAPAWSTDSDVDVVKDTVKEIPSLQFHTKYKVHYSFKFYVIKY